MKKYTEEKKLSVLDKEADMNVVCNQAVEAKYVQKETT